MAAESHVCIYLGEDLERYAFGGDHPFGPDRMGVFWEEASRRSLASRVEVIAPVQATREEMTRFHDAAYVERVIRQSRDGFGFLDLGDTPAFEGIYEAVSFVVGSTLDACARLMRGECRHVFIPIAGLHHARRDAAAGFCAMNDCGVAIETLKREFGARRGRRDQAQRPAAPRRRRRAFPRGLGAGRVLRRRGMPGVHPLPVRRR